jgi:hypothetical protein
MANGSDHRTGAALGLGAVAALNWRDGNHWMTHPVIASAMGWACGTLPDVLEPATGPNHRQFRHSALFAGILIYGVKRLLDWKPQTDAEKVLSYALLLVGGAYGIHLFMDAMTSKSLPLIGKL